ncbi:retrovirus-related pol polyprotein from transposon TNT 1-94 [Tanacetum coccineum]
MKGKEDRRCFKCGDLNNFISDCPKHSFNDQMMFVRRYWSESDEEDESKKDEISLMALDNNEDYLTKFDPKSTEGVFLGYSPNSKAYIILNKETMRIEESLNVIFDESPPLKSSPIVDDDIIESQIIENQVEDIEIKENKPLNKEIVNIKESKDYPIDSVIDIHDLRSVETEFPSIAFNDGNPRIISTNDLKTDSENDSEKVMPLLPSPEPMVSCFGNLNFFKDFENEFPAIVYNDAPTSKSELLTEPILNPQISKKFDLKNKRYLSKCDEEEQNILYFNDLFPFNEIYPDDSKSDS